MPSTAVIAGSVVGILLVAALGIGLGVGLTRDDDDDGGTAAAEGGTASRGGIATAGTAGGVSGGFAASPTDSAPEPVGPTSPTMAFAPTPRSIFGPGGSFAPGPAAPSAVPSATPAAAPTTAPLAAPTAVPAGVPAGVPIAVVAVDDEAPVPAREEEPEEAPVPAPEPDELEEAPVPAPEPEEPEEAPAPAPELVAPTSGFGALEIIDGRYAVCAGNYQDSDDWGKACGFSIGADGSVDLGEWFGGFDGFWSTDPADGHESCFNGKVIDMFGLPKCEVQVNEEESVCLGTDCACLAPQKKPAPAAMGSWPGNKGVVTFLKTLLDRADPTNYDFPEDEERADNGGRQDNVDDTIAAWQDLIVVNC